MRQYSLMHFHAIFDNPLTLKSIYNAVEVGVITAFVGGMLAFAIGYTIHRTQRGRAGARSTCSSTLPVAIPGLVIGVAYLWAWIGIPGGLYGTIWILALAFIARFMPDTVKALSTSFLQIHRELEEAAWVCGRGHARHHPHHRAAAGEPRRDRRDDAAVRAGDPRTRLVAVSLHQQHHGDVGAAARLLRRRQYRQDRGVQPGADRAARRADRRAPTGCRAARRRPASAEPDKNKARENWR